jgi:hypothetical protein
MREIASELRSLRLHGMAGRFEELLAQGDVNRNRILIHPHAGSELQI